MALSRATFQRLIAWPLRFTRISPFFLSEVKTSRAVELKTSICVECFLVWFCADRSSIRRWHSGDKATTYLSVSSVLYKNYLNLWKQVNFCILQSVWLRSLLTREVSWLAYWDGQSSVTHTLRPPILEDGHSLLIRWRRCVTTLAG